MLQFVLDVCQVVGRDDGRLLLPEIVFEARELCCSRGGIDGEVRFVGLQEAVLFFLDGFLAFVNREVVCGDDLPVPPRLPDVELEDGVVVAWHVPAYDKQCGNGDDDAIHDGFSRELVFLVVSVHLCF